MDATDLARRFRNDEGAAGTELALEHLADGQGEMEFNVWFLHVDHERGMVRYEHDFDPHEGEIPLNELVAALRARLQV